jgi:hypothetical protein
MKKGSRLYLVTITMSEYYVYDFTTGAYTVMRVDPQAVAMQRRQHAWRNLMRRYRGLPALPYRESRGNAIPKLDVARGLN